MLREEGLENVFRRHDRHAEATRCAVRAWGLEVWCRHPDEHSSSLTAVQVPEGHSADALRRTILETFDMSLGNGLGRLADTVFRIGHLGAFNDLMLAGTLSRHRDGARSRRGAAPARRRGCGPCIPDRSGISQSRRPVRSTRRARARNARRPSGASAREAPFGRWDGVVTKSPRSIRRGELLMRHRSNTRVTLFRDRPIPCIAAHRG